MPLSRSAALLATAGLWLSGCGALPGDVDSPQAGDSSAHLDTSTPGFARKDDADGNGYPDSGVLVTGHYTSLYAEDANGDWWWDLGDGRIQGSVPSLAALDARTRTDCDYQINYRGDFNNTALLDSGWIDNNIRCHGYTRSTSHYLLVHRTDPRYTGNPDWAVWGDWEYHVLTESGAGNLVRPFYRPSLR